MSFKAPTARKVAKSNQSSCMSSILSENRADNKVTKSPRRFAGKSSQSTVFEKPADRLKKTDTKTKNISELGSQKEEKVSIKICDKKPTDQGVFRQSSPSKQRSRVATSMSVILGSDKAPSSPTKFSKAGTLGNRTNQSKHVINLTPARVLPQTSRTSKGLESKIFDSTPVETKTTSASHFNKNAETSAPLTQKSCVKVSQPSGGKSTFSLQWN
eukprot:TRINITY_DN11816_c0_g1_i1.p1 TRINITY_DN11816_c0_g1~~TRINITY_DN11816_c0_g1_i1.p1  ORF type:complete len:214 (+),score=33.86 TRINITY_DN11816_c0_g1_i1:73-714(+)